MKILWVKAGGLLPLDSGGKIRSYNILRELARNHQITFFSFHSEQDDVAQRGLREVFANVVCVPLKLPAPKSLAELAHYSTALFSPEPYAIRKYCRPEVARKLAELLERERFDVIVCDFLVAAGVIPWDADCPKVLFTHNVEALIWKRHYEVARNPLWKALSWREWKAMEEAEREYLKKADHVLAVSDADRDSFASFIAPEKLTVIPTGVDIDYFQPPGTAEEPDSLVFTGSMDWLPNEDGIRYFVEEILPLIQKEIPSAGLRVVGRRPSRKLQELSAASSGGVQLTGWVDDIRPHLAKGAVCIVPLRIGSGTRLKIFEAMAMGKAVVSTTIGAEGLPARDGSELLLADSPADFAAATIRLLRDETSRHKIGKAARLLVESKYGWRTVADEFTAALEKVSSSEKSNRVLSRK